MTRRGSLVYYLAAVAVGCFFTSVCLALALPAGSRWPTGSAGAADFFGFYFINLSFGAFAALLFAGVLRRLTAWLGWMRWWQWVVSGAGAASLVVWGLHLLGLAMLRVEPRAWFWSSFFLVGPTVLVDSGIWPAPVSGALTAVVLHRIHRAFEPREEPVTHA